MSRKRPLWSKSVFSQSDENISPQKSSQTESSSSQSLNFPKNSNQKLRKTSSQQNSKIMATKLTDKQISSSEWVEIFSPKFIDDLAVNVKKISEIENWLLNHDGKKEGKILLLTGPTGSGKSTALRVLAKKINYELIEWITPIDIEDESYHHKAGDFGDNKTFKESQIQIFKRFLFRASRYGTIFEDKQKRFIIVEDIPNVFIKDSSLFSEILQNYELYGKSPLIFIVTDSKSRKLNLSYNLFPDEMRNQLQIKNVNFNRVSDTLMKKAIKRISNLMNENRFIKLYDVPNQNLIDSIVLASNGDIRNACINLHFVSLKGAPQLVSFSSETKTKKNYKANRSKIEGGCDESITLMHALGRVFYPKIDLESKKLTHSPEEICQSFLPEPKNFIDFMFANYLTHFATIENIVMATDIYSQSDVFMSDYRENLSSEFGLNLAIRGNMVYNVNPVSTWASIRGPKKFKHSMNYFEELKLIGSNNHMTRKNFSTDYKSYGKIIKNNSISSYES